jgi:hypothetical protein
VDNLNVTGVYLDDNNNFEALENRQVDVPLKLQEIKEC